MTCLESDFLIALMHKDAEAVQKFLNLEKGSLPLCITPITAAELFHGAFKSKNPSELEKVESVLSALCFLYFDFLSAKYCGSIMAFLDKAGHIGDLDTLTGAICARYGETLVTKNIKHFSKIKNLKIE